MSTFRGFDSYLISRADRAGSHWFDADTLRFFDSYGGRSQRVGPDVYVVVSSERDHGPYAAHNGQRTYSVRVFVFAPKSDERPWNDALTVETASVTDPDTGESVSGFGAFTNGKSAGRYADKVADRIREAFPTITRAPSPIASFSSGLAHRPVSADQARQIAELVTSL